MYRLRRYLQSLLTRLFGSSQARDGLTAVEYEAVCLITYEGREAYARACEQASYCHERGSAQGYRFWSEVAVEIDRRTGARATGTAEQLK